MTANFINSGWGVKGSGSHGIFKKLYLITVVSFCISFLFSCRPTNNLEAINASNKSTEIRKAELIKLLDRNFNNPDAQYELGQIYHNEGNWSQAEWRYQRAISFDPVHWQSKAAMVKLYIDSGEPAKARTVADVYMNEVSNSENQSLLLAAAFQAKGLNDYALAAYQQAMGIAPDSAKVHKQLGYYYLSIDDKAKAEEHFVLSYRYDNNQPEVARELGKLGVEIRRPQSPNLQTGSANTSNN